MPTAALIEPPPALAPDRRTRKKQRTRREIFDAAMELFARHGYEAVTIDAICDAADVGRSTFFLHFPAKSALLGEFSRRLTEDFAAGLRLRPHANSAQELVALVREIGQRIAAQRESMLAMIREFILTPEALEHTRVRERALPDLFEQIVRRGQASGEFSRRIHPRLATGAILSTAASILCGWVFEDGQVSPDEVMHQYLEIVFHGIGGTIPKSRRAARFRPKEI